MFEMILKKAAKKAIITNVPKRYMFDLILKRTVKNAIKNERYAFSGLLVSLYNKLNISISPTILNDGYDGKNILDGAIISGNCDTVKLLLNHGAKLNVDLKNRVSCLNIAIADKNVEMLEILMEHIENRSFFRKTPYDKEVASLLNANDLTKKNPLITAIDLFINSNDEAEKESLKKCMKLIYTNSLFNRNNEKLYNDLWKEKANYYLEYDKRAILNSTEDYILSTKNKELIDFFIENGLRYIEKPILCVNTNWYTHSAIILKFNEPIKFKDSDRDVAGVLYSFEIRNKMDNSRKTFSYKLARFLRVLVSWKFPCDAYMKRVVLTSEDIEKILKNDYSKLFDVKNKDVMKVVSKTYETIDKLKNVEGYSNLRLIKLLRELTTNIEEVSYLFSIYRKDYNNFTEKHRIIKCDFINDIPLLEINNNVEEGYSIYDFIWKKPEELKLTYKQKISTIEEFLNKECLSILKENNIIREYSMDFDIYDFIMLSERRLNDLHDKEFYSEVYTFDYNNSEKECVKAISGHKLMTRLEEYNINIEEYSLLKNNCITTLKEALSECGYKKQIAEVDKELNSCSKIHPLSVLNKLREIEFNSKQLKTIKNELNYQG